MKDGGVPVIRGLQDTPGAASPCQPHPLTRGAVPQRLDLTDAMLQPLQPQAELQLLLAPVEAEGQVPVLGQSRER